MNGRISRRIAPVLALVAAACSAAAGSQLADVKGPTAVVAFLGKTHEKPGKVVPYLAVAASRGDELRIFDPETDAVIRSPGVAFPLSIPTLTRPLYLAAAPLNDVDGSGNPLPDVLLVAGPGHVVQLVSTWEDTEADPQAGMRVVAEWDLSPWAGTGAAILSMVGAPVPGTVFASGAVPIAPPIVGRGRVLIGFSGSSDGQGGKLVVLDFERDPNATVSGQVRLSAPPFVQHLGFDPVALSLSPDNFHLDAATPDPVTDTGGGRTVLGVGEVTMGTDASAPWTIRGLDARSPTTLVASAILGERIEEVDPNAGDPPFGEPARRVYAALDTSSCGVDKPIACGIATLNVRTGGLAAEIAPPGASVPAQTFRAPMQVPGVPLAIAVAMPPLTGDAQKLSQGPSAKYPGAVEQPLERISPATGTRWTTALMVVASSAGPSWVLDLGRTWAPNDASLLINESTRTKVYTAQSIAGAGGSARISLDPLNGVPTAITDDSLLPAAIAVTPGFTPTETWQIVYQGPLPDLVARPGVISSVSGTAPWLAIQEDAAPAGSTPVWIPGANLYDPRLGIQVGDVVAFTVFPASDDPCPPVPPATYHEVMVADLLPPDAVNYPGGAVQLAPAGNQTPADAFCIFGTGTSARDTVPVAVTIGAREYVLTGSVTGYAGRPAYLGEFSLAWANEAPLLAACPLLQEPPPSPMPACDPACRAQCEALVLARKARRTDYPAEPPCAGTTPCYKPYPDMIDPLQAGPVLRFTLDVTNSAGGLTRGATLSFSTQSGISQMSRRPSLLSQGTSAISFDKSRYPGKEGLGAVFYVTYLGDLLFEMPPGEAVTGVATIR
jgi:hypothetical protein